MWSRNLVTLSLMASLCADDGINFNRKSFRRVRKVLDRASASKRFSPLVDIHTGNSGSASPPAVSYLSHFPFADSAWNGEGFDWNGDADYWLVEVSGFIHGITADRLGGNDDIKGMLFGMYRRNSAEQGAIWRLWDSVQIANSQMIGFWEDDAPVRATTTPPPPPSPPSGNCTRSFTTTRGSYIRADGGANGVLGFGHACGRPGGPTYPSLTVAQAEATCCNLSQCVGFSWLHSAPPDTMSSGCFQMNDGGRTHDAAYDGYLRHGGGGGGNLKPCDASGIKVTTFVTFAKQALIVVASWCPSPSVVVSLSINWAELGLDATTVSVTQPAIKGMQAARESVDYRNLTVGRRANGGVILVVRG